MSRLRDRIASNGQIGPDLTVIGKDYNDVKSIPLVRIQIRPGVILYDQLQPLLTSDGAPVAATGPGTWGQLYAAGTRGSGR
jgi:hypothetical protein